MFARVKELQNTAPGQNLQDINLVWWRTGQLLKMAKV
jgi:hypothetical protein